VLVFDKKIFIQFVETQADESCNTNVILLHAGGLQAQQ
jgi:hypothetical protein